MHPGTVDISMDEERMDLLPKTPAPRKRRARNQKNTKSVEEVEAGIKHVAAYEKQSLNEEFLNTTLQPLVTSAATGNHPETHDLSKDENGGDAADNASYKPPSESTLEVIMTDGGIGSLPDPVGEMVGKEKRTAGHVRRKDDQRKHVVKVREEESPTELDDKPTPFKKVMGMKGKVFVKDTEQTTMPKGKGRALVISEDSITESDDELSFQKKATVALVKPTQVSKDPTVVDNLATGSTTERVERILAKTRPKTKPASGHPAPSATTCVPITKTSKLTSKLNRSNNSDIDVESQKLPQPSMSKSKSSEPKTEAAKVKEALRDVQEAFKKVREEARRVKEIAKEPGVHDRIKALNKEANAEPGQLHPTCLSQLPKGKIIRTY